MCKLVVVRMMFHPHNFPRNFTRYHNKGAALISTLLLSDLRRIRSKGMPFPVNTKRYVFVHNFFLS